MQTFIDARLLSESELPEFKRLDKVVFAPGDMARFVVVCLAYPAVTIFLLVTSVNLEGDPGDLDSLFELLGTVLMFTGWVPAVSAWKGAASNAQVARKERLLAYRRTLPGYDLRTLRQAPGGGDGTAKSRRQMQHEWYGGHSELNYTDRVRGEMYGMDADTYISNVAEHDKD